LLATKSAADRIVIGGGVANAGERLFGYIRQTIRTRCEKTFEVKRRKTHIPMHHPAQIYEPSEKRANYFVRITAAIAALAGLLFGFDTGVISGAILFIKGEFGLTPLTEELLVSAALMGAVCGSTLSGRLTDVIGRAASNSLKPLLEEWMRSYKPEELFDQTGKLLPELRELTKP
jgi:hypothetical protein